MNDPNEVTTSTCTHCQVSITAAPSVIAGHIVICEMEQGQKSEEAHTLRQNTQMPDQDQTLLDYLAYR